MSQTIIFGLHQKSQPCHAQLSSSQRNGVIPRKNSGNRVVWQLRLITRDSRVTTGITPRTACLKPIIPNEEMSTVLRPIETGPYTASPIGKQYYTTRLRENVKVGRYFGPHICHKHVTVLDTAKQATHPDMFLTLQPSKTQLSFSCSSPSSPKMCSREQKLASS
jgi:hypothetical protein